MKGLFTKDFYMVTPQIKIFLVMGIIMALVTSGEVVPYIVLYASMLSMTAMAYDEQCKWNVLAKMMPYSFFDTVFCKYLLGGAAALIMGALCFVSQFFFGVVMGGEPFAEVLLMQALYIAIAMILQAINLPLMFLFGVEKGRIWFMLFNIAAVVFSFQASEELAESAAGISIPFPAVVGAAALLAVLLSVLSVFLSVKFYNRKNRT
ncbi:MAG: ABC-2 transporter permease [Oscillospiraceae bacterium]